MATAGWMDCCGRKAAMYAKLLSFPFRLVCGMANCLSWKGLTFIHTRTNNPVISMLVSEGNNNNIKKNVKRIYITLCTMDQHLIAGRTALVVTTRHRQIFIIRLQRWWCMHACMYACMYAKYNRDYLGYLRKLTFFGIKLTTIFKIYNNMTV